MDHAATSTPSGLPLITVSVVSHGDGPEVQSLLLSLARHEEPQRLQLIVTDNLGDDLPDLGPSNWNSAIVLRNAYPEGYAKNHNAAFRRAGGQYFCILNPDVVFVEGTFQSLLGSLQTGQADIAGPIVVDSAGRIQDSFRRLPTPLELLGRRVIGSTYDHGILQGEQIHPDWIAGTFLFMRSQTYSKLGGFDERYHLYFEDVDLCTRARLMGLSLTVNTHVRVQHDARRASRRPGRYLVWHLQSAIRFFVSPVYRQARTLQSQGPSAPTRR
jgi:N-acetylglucosaminyl-diphospho-decaprenol L-rhamnosyltransferase